MLKAQLEVENENLKAEIEELRRVASTSASIGAEMHVAELKHQLSLWQRRVYDLERVLEKIALPAFVARCDMLGLKDSGAIDVGIRAGDLREAYKVLSAEPEEELVEMMEAEADAMDTAEAFGAGQLKEDDDAEEDA